MRSSRAAPYAPLLRLYPRAWRARYEDEFLALLEERPTTPLQLLDIIVGALDAHVHREIPDAEPAPEQRPRRSWTMTRNLFGATALAAAALLVFNAFGGMLGLDLGLALVFASLMLAALVVATFGLAQRSHHPRVAAIGVALTGMGAIASLGALALIALEARSVGNDGWTLASFTLAALLIGQALVAASARGRPDRTGRASLW